MTVLERKKYIHEKIENTFDEEILEKVEKLLNEKEIYILSDEQLARVEEARAQYRRGECLSDEEVQKRVDKWFDEQEE